VIDLAESVTDIDIESVATGGEGVGHRADGRTLFVAGALPGERVRVEITESRRRHDRGVVSQVLRPAPARRPPPCPHVARGCGGCDWQHVDEPTQRDLRLRIVADALRRIGRIPDPPLVCGPPGAAGSGRTTVRAGVIDGRAGFRRRRSHEIVAVDSCLVTHPAAEAVLVDSGFGPAEEVVVRVGARTGDRLVVASPTAAGVAAPDGVRVVGADELAAGTRAWIHEEVAGRRWRVSARSFFQASPEGAEALVAAVGRGVDRLGPDPGGRLVDLCAGVGLFAGSIGRDWAEVTAVEPSRSAVADVRHNLGRDGARVVRAPLDRWRPSRADLVIADPPRAGLGRAGVERVVATGAAALVLVSCDVGSLGRDAGLLAAAGYRLVSAEVLDLFPQTSHVEVVSAFAR